MATVVIGGLDSHASSDVVTSYCQKFGRLLNCYVNAGQCVVTFANHLHATEFIRAAPHQIGSSSQVTACWKTSLQQNAPPAPRPPSDSHDHCRLTVRGTCEQLQQNSLLQYFSRYGQVRMCLPNPAQGCATVTFTDRTSCERVLKEPRHFLNGRSLVVELGADADNVSPPKRMKVPDSAISSSNAHVEHEKQQLHERLQWCEYEKQQLSNLLNKQYAELTQQLATCQGLLKQSLEELLSKDKQIEQLKQENKDIDELLRQSVHDNEQQQIHVKRREEVHSQTKRKYEELYKAYTKLKDNCAIQRDKDVTVILDPVPSSLSALNKSKSAIDGVRKRSRLF